MKKTLFAILLSIATLFTSPTALYANQNTNTIHPRADLKVWKYKIVNGKLYKRLWNSSKKRWETKWIPA